MEILHDHSAKLQQEFALLISILFPYLFSVFVGLGACKLFFQVRLHNLVTWAFRFNKTKWFSIMYGVSLNKSIYHLQVVFIGSLCFDNCDNVFTYLTYKYFLYVLIGYFGKH